jgi:hypothetical protein
MAMATVKSTGYMSELDRKLPTMVARTVSEITEQLLNQYLCSVHKDTVLPRILRVLVLESPEPNYDGRYFLSGQDMSAAI